MRSASHAALYKSHAYPASSRVRPTFGQRVSLAQTRRWPSMAGGTVALRERHGHVLGSICHTLLLPFLTLSLRFTTFLPRHQIYTHISYFSS